MRAALWMSMTVGAAAALLGGVLTAADDVLSAADAAAVVRTAVTSLDDPTLAVAVVDRSGQIVAAYARPPAPSSEPITPRPRRAPSASSAAFIFRPTSATPRTRRCTASRIRTAAVPSA